MPSENKVTEKTLERKRGPELLAHFGTVLADRLAKEGQPPEKASEIALNIMDYMRVEFGGQNIYFPQGIRKKSDAKAVEIFDKFYAGTSIQELAYEYQHSIQWIYKIVADERARRKAVREAEREAQRAKEQERWEREN